MLKPANGQGPFGLDGETAEDPTVGYRTPETGA